MIALLLAMTASAADICAYGCTYTTVQDAVDNVAPGALAVLSLGGGYYDAPVVVDEGRRVLLISLNLDPVVLTAPPGPGAVITVLGGSTLSTTGISIDADGVRGVDASEGSTVNLTLGTLYGGGPVGAGALVRVRDGVLSAAGVTFVDGQSIGDGGLIYAENSDVDLAASSLLDGSGSSGGGLFARSTGSRNTVTLTLCGFSGLTATLNGGALAFDGELDVLIDGGLMDQTFAQAGGGIAVLSAGVVLSVQGGFGSGTQSVGSGGYLYQTAGTTTLTDVAIGSAASRDGGAVALKGGTLTLDRVFLVDNLALDRGGGLFADGGVLHTRDLAVFQNEAVDGGGLWLGPAVTVPAFVRNSICGNTALSGGGAWIAANADMELRNVRFLDNLAFLDGGAVRHQGSGGLRLQAVNLLGNTSGGGGGAAISTTGTLQLVDALVGHSSGGVAIRRESDTPVVIGGGSSWWLNERGDAVDLSPTTPGALFTDPQLLGYTPGEDCLTIQDWGGWYGPLRDAGSAGIIDPDGTRADIGAYGGPDADPEKWTVDSDADGSPVLYDCDEQDPLTHPLADDPPYDGLDANCDGADDFDADGDGHRPPDHGGLDCDDARADVFPGAEERALEPPVDQNCDGRFDADGDGFEPPIDCDDADPDAYPGAVDADPNRDLDCDGFVDGPRPIRPVGCNVGGTPERSAGLLLVALFIRRRRSKAGGGPRG